MKNISINRLTQILSPLLLDVKTSLARRRFLRHIKGFNDDYLLEIEYLKKDLSEKNADGSPKVVDNVIQFTKENRLKLNKKFKDLDAIKIEVDWTGEEKDKELVLGLLEKEKEKLNLPDGISDQVMEGIESLEEIISELKEKKL